AGVSGRGEGGGSLRCSRGRVSLRGGGVSIRGGGVMSRLGVGTVSRRGSGGASWRGGTASGRGTGAVSRRVVGGRSWRGAGRLSRSRGCNDRGGGEPGAPDWTRSAGRDDRAALGTSNGTVRGEALGRTGASRRLSSSRSARDRSRATTLSCPAAR